MSVKGPPDPFVAQAYRHAAELVRVGLEHLRTHGGPSEPVFKTLIALFDAAADEWSP